MKLEIKTGNRIKFLCLDAEEWNKVCKYSNISTKTRTGIYNKKWVSVESLIEELGNMYKTYNPIEINKRITKLLKKLYN